MQSVQYLFVFCWSLFPALTWVSANWCIANLPLRSLLIFEYIREKVCSHLIQMKFWGFFPFLSACHGCWYWFIFILWDTFNSLSPFCSLSDSNFHVGQSFCSPFQSFFKPQLLQLLLLVSLGILPLTFQKGLIFTSKFSGAVLTPPVLYMFELCTAFCSALMQERYQLTGFVLGNQNMGVFSL